MAVIRVIARVVAQNLLNAVQPEYRTSRAGSALQTTKSCRRPAAETGGSICHTTAGTFMLTSGATVPLARCLLRTCTDRTAAGCWASVARLCRRNLMRRMLVKRPCCAHTRHGQDFAAVKTLGRGSPKLPRMSAETRDGGRCASPHASLRLRLSEEYSPDCYEEFVRRARCELLQEALSSLPLSIRVPLYLRDIEGRSVGEIAQLRNRTVGSVRSSLTRHRKMLANRVEELARARHQWPLPVVAPLTGRFRSRFARMKAASELAVGGARMQIETAVWALRSIRVAVVLHVAISVAALVNSSGAGGNAEGSPPDPKLTSPGAHTVAPPPAGPPLPAGGRSDPPPRTSAVAPVVLGDARLRDGGRTATPTAAATPVPGNDGVRVVIGPAGVDCTSPEKQGTIVRASCEALSRAPIPSSGIGADEH